MNSGQLDALRDIVRQAVGADLDELVARLDQLERRTLPAEDLSRRLAAIEQLNGIRPRPAGQAARREQVKQLHERGLSQRVIAVALDVNRSAISADMAQLGLEPKPDAIDAAGRRLGGMATRSRNGRATTQIDQSGRVGREGSP